MPRQREIFLSRCFIYVVFRCLLPRFALALSLHDLFAGEEGDFGHLVGKEQALAKAAAIVPIRVRDAVRPH